MTKEEFEKKWGSVLSGKTSWAEVSRPTPAGDEGSAESSRPRTAPSGSSAGTKAAAQTGQRRAAAAAGTAPADTPVVRPPPAPRSPEAQGLAPSPPSAEEDFPSQVPSAPPAPPAPPDPDSFRGRTSKMISDVQASFAPLAGAAGDALSAARDIGTAGYQRLLVEPQEELQRRAMIAQLKRKGL